MNDDYSHDITMELERQRLEEKLLDAANELVHFMGYSAVKVPGRHANGVAVYVGTASDVVQMATGPASGSLASTCSQQ